MALQHPIIETKEHFAGNLVCDSAYWRVDELVGNKQLIAFNANAYVSSEGPMLYSSRFEFIPNLNGPNFIQQAYEYLKTLPEFADAVDC